MACGHSCEIFVQCVFYLWLLNYTVDSNWPSSAITHQSHYMMTVHTPYFSLMRSGNGQFINLQTSYCDYLEFRSLSNLRFNFDFLNVCIGHQKQKYRQCNIPYMLSWVYECSYTFSIKDHALTNNPFIKMFETYQARAKRRLLTNLEDISTRRANSIWPKNVHFGKTHLEDSNITRESNS